MINLIERFIEDTEKMNVCAIIDKRAMITVKCISSWEKIQFSVSTRRMIKLYTI